MSTRKSSNTTKTIANVVKQARLKYEELMESEYISVRVRIDGKETRGQAKDNESIYNLQDKNSKLMTCTLDIDVNRGSYVEMQEDSYDEEYKNKGIVTSLPNKTPVDNYFTVLFFNTTITRHRKMPVYNMEGDVIEDNPLITDTIDAYVERVSTTERRYDAGIEKNSVNKIITLKKWDIQKNDLLYIGTNCYRVTDIEELEEDYFSAYMTYYRE